MDLGFTGRTVLVTGGSSGVGRATVRMLLDEGAQVATCGRRPEPLAALGDHDRLHTAVCDIRDPEAVRRLVDGVQDRFGGLDGLVNNAGQSRMKPFAECTTTDWRDELELKFDGVLNPLHAALPLLRASDAAAVVNVNAVLAREPSPRLITTSAARAGLLNLSKSLSRELAPDGIRVNSVCLGLVDTGQWERRHRAEGGPSTTTGGRPPSPPTGASPWAGSAAPRRSPTPSPGCSPHGPPTSPAPASTSAAASAAGSEGAPPCPPPTAATSSSASCGNSASTPSSASSPSTTCPSSKPSPATCASSPSATRPPPSAPPTPTAGPGVPSAAP